MVRYKVLASFIISALVLTFLARPVGAESIPNPKFDILFRGGQQSGVVTESSCSFLQGSVANNTCNISRVRFYNSRGQLLALQKGQSADVVLSVSARNMGLVLGYLNTGNANVSVTDVVVNPLVGANNEQPQLGSSGQYITGQNYQSSMVLKVTLSSSADNQPVSLGVSGSTFIWGRWNLTYQPSPMTVDVIAYPLSVRIYTPVDTAVEDEVNQNELEGQDNIEGQDTTGTNQGVSDDNYSSLLDIFTGFITAITNVSGGSCTISLNTDFANLGNVDLCTYDPPSYIQIIGSIILILLFVPLSMALIKRILKTIQELQT